MRTKLLNLFGIVLTIVLWGLQMIQVFPVGWFTDFVKAHILLVASLTGGAVLFYHLFDLFNSKHTVRRQWLRKFFAHIIETELGGDNYYTKISLMRPKYGYQIILPYLYYCFFLSFYENSVNRKWQLRIKNIPIHLRTQYLTVYARYSYPKTKRSYTHFRITGLENHYNGIAEKAFRDGQVENAKSLKISDVVMNTELDLLPGPDSSKIRKYMRDFHISDYYYNTLQNINQPPNHIIAVPILRDVEAWGVMTIDINSDNYGGFNEELVETMSNYAKIISQTIIFI